MTDIYFPGDSVRFSLSLIPLRSPPALLMKSYPVGASANVSDPYYAIGSALFNVGFDTASTYLLAAGWAKS